MIKIILKLLKYAVVIYLLIFFKNLYSETFLWHPAITVQSPDIMGIQEVQTVIEDNSSFSEQMDFYSPDNQEKLKNELELQQRLKQDSATIDSYKESLEQGLNEQTMIDAEPSEWHNHHFLPFDQIDQNNKKERRQLRGIAPGFDSYNQNNAQEEQLPVPPAMIELD